jgi:hypothetical protein
VIVISRLVVVAAGGGKDNNGLAIVTHLHHAEDVQLYPGVSWKQQALFAVAGGIANIHCCKIDDAFLDGAA